MKNVYAVSALFLALCSGGAQASTSVAAGLASASYSQSGSYMSSTAEVAFNGGGWNLGNYGNGWIQVDLGASMAINEVSFKTGQLPDGEHLLEAVDIDIITALAASPVIEDDLH